MDTFSEPLIDSETTGLPSPEPRAESSTGPLPGATGYEKTPTTLAGALKELQSTAAEKPPRKPTDNEPWRQASLVQLIADEAPRPPVTDAAEESTRPRWRPPPSLTDEQTTELRALIARGQRSIQPAGAELVGAMLLKLIAVHPTGEREGVDIMMDTYVEDLSDLPADLLDGACTHWRRTERFFPTIAELRALAVPALAKRRKYLERLLTLRGVAELPAPDDVVTFAWLSDRRAAGRRAAGRRAVNALTDPRLRVAA